MLLPTKILHKVELPSLLRKKRERKGELDPLLTPKSLQMPELDLQLTHNWPKNPELEVLLTQSSIQRCHRPKLPTLAKIPLFQPTWWGGKTSPIFGKLWLLAVVWVACDGPKRRPLGDTHGYCISASENERERERDRERGFNVASIATVYVVHWLYALHTEHSSVLQSPPVPGPTPYTACPFCPVESCSRGVARKRNLCASKIAIPIQIKGVHLMSSVTH